jgi:hypothetical protein
MRQWKATSTSTIRKKIDASLSARAATVRSYAERKRRTKAGRRRHRRDRRLPVVRSPRLSASPFAVSVRGVGRIGDAHVRRDGRREAVVRWSA